MWFKYDGCVEWETDIGWVNQNQIGYILQGFQDEKIVTNWT